MAVSLILNVSPVLKNLLNKVSVPVTLVDVEVIPIVPIPAEIPAIDGVVRVNDPAFVVPILILFPDIASAVEDATLK